jgi:hypothetical protein
MNSMLPKMKALWRQWICLLCVYICHYIFPFHYLDIFFIFICFCWHWDRKHYYIKAVESIQFVCTGNSGISRVLCNANSAGLELKNNPSWILNRPVGVCITQNSRNPRISSAYKLYAFYYFYIVVLSVSVSTKTNKNKKNIRNDFEAGFLITYRKI